MSELVKEARETYTRWDNPPSPELPDNAGIVLRLANRIEELEAGLREAETLIAGELTGIEWKKACRKFLGTARALLNKEKKE